MSNLSFCALYLAPHSFLPYYNGIIQNIERAWKLVNRLTNELFFCHQSQCSGFKYKSPSKRCGVHGEGHRRKPITGCIFWRTNLFFSLGTFSRLYCVYCCIFLQKFVDMFSFFFVTIWAYSDVHLQSLTNWQSMKCPLPCTRQTLTGGFRSFIFAWVLQLVAVRNCFCESLYQLYWSLYNLSDHCILVRLWSAC